MKTVTEFANATVKICGSFCYSCKKYLARENFSSSRVRKCKECEKKHSKPKGVATVGGALSYRPVYKG